MSLQGPLIILAYYSGITGSKSMVGLVEFLDNVRIMDNIGIGLCKVGDNSENVHYELLVGKPASDFFTLQ